MTGLRDLAVIGAGPAGLAAAARAAELGLDTILIDEQPAPGGQVYRNVEGLAARPRDLERLGGGYRDGLALAQAFRASGADYRPGTAVWSIEEGAGEARVILGLRDDAGAGWLHARWAILATGAMERAVPLPGWTLPGVMTVGAAQTLLKASDLVPEQPVTIAANGNFTYDPTVSTTIQNLTDADTPVDTQVLVDLVPAVGHAFGDDGNIPRFDILQDTATNLSAVVGA